MTTTPTPTGAAGRTTPTDTTAGTGAGGGMRSRLPSLTGMRFLAAMLVFLFHSSRLTPALTMFHGTTAHWYSTICYEGGWVGVSFFFILSGFVLTWTAKTTDTPRRFWRRRALKLYPNHIATFTATMLLLAYATPWHQWLPNLLLIQTWIPSPHLNTIFSVDQPSWSLSCEIIFYLCFPLLHRTLLKIKPTHLWTCAAIITTAVATTATIAQFALPTTHMTPAPGGPIFQASEWQVWVVYALPPVRMLEFALGMTMARIAATGRWINLPLLPALTLTLAAYAASYTLPWTYAATTACLIPLALLITAAATTDIHNTHSPFRTKTLILLGEISFAFYLIHGPVIGYLRTQLGTTTYNPLTATALTLTALTIATTLAWLLHTLIEQPIMHRWSHPKTHHPTTTPHPSRIIATHIPTPTPTNTNTNEPTPTPTPNEPAPTPANTPLTTATATPETD